MVEFVLISVPLVLLALSVLGVALGGFVRNVLFDSAVEGARFAALADQDVSSGCQRAQVLLLQTLGSAIKPQIFCDEALISERRLVLVSVEARIPGLGFLPNSFNLKAVAHATAELQ